MTQLRGLLTAREREILREETSVSWNYLHQDRSHVRREIDALDTDVEVLRSHQQDLYGERNETPERESVGAQIENRRSLPERLSSGRPSLPVRQANLSQETAVYVGSDGRGTETR